MVFFANSYIESRKQEKRDQQDSFTATLLMEMDDNLSYEDALEKVRNQRRRYEAGLLTVPPREST